MTLEILRPAFSVCKLADIQTEDLSGEFVFFARTDNEISLVCPSGAAPVRAVAREDGWRAIRVAGALDFSLIGILADITARLAERQISVFAVSTYDTDYLLIKRERLGDAAEALSQAYSVIGQAADKDR